ncbi:tyrosine-type recombinase/integrase [Aeromonas veronii]|uniref:tyrosine-type recombinase/integrase n=1 Tax=Aeromonas veronii TaxID=654 RepID=UPI000E094867|nr:tyrosine-type recombinase/integrase [Aeromonas veronii]RDE61021.1 hypothetical protein DV708_17120 [Aeromonas veronii]
MSELIPAQQSLPSSELHSSPIQIDLNQLRPDSLADLMSKGWLRGVRLENDPQIQAVMQRFLDEFRESEERYSPRTLLQLTCMWGQFAEWCTENNEPYLPASFETVKRYLSQRAQDKHRNTLSLDKWSISRYHRVCGCPDPTLDQSVKDLMAALIRTKVMADESIEQASAMRECHIDELVQIWGGSEHLADRRDLAMLVVAYESLLRSKELANIRIKHLQVKSDGSGLLTIPISKTNKSGEPDYVYLSRQAVRLIREYMSAAGRSLVVHPERPDEPLFGGLNRVGKSVKVIKVMTYTTIYKIFSRAWEALDLESVGIPRFSAHSARVGAAQDLAANGYNSLQIMMSGRWASEVMVGRYCRNIFAEEGAMAKMRHGRR